ncbi:glycosyltransferase family 4 protein [Serratia sp. Lou2A]|uniref:Glycosyltransferase family 4 protein n=1 Tax=Serratia montpellierensis TaxID=2598730 RepID=A0ABS8J5Y7_9GAMM|nr:MULTISPECIES: glycosyltransferase family 1 protein [unclassified Serratia (in: enterobacteria)]MCC7583285.1 glycosyltransferase family 4 protein [Serratia sp. Lou2A]MCC7659449.1 glycosyltransferase family 4 protein [Serratia sp. Pon4B]BEM42382.1 glycosyl transferase family 1 [Serratia marcescens]
MKRIVIDNRWSGTGGIGTFSARVNAINNYPDAGFHGAPYSPLDCIKTTLTLLLKKKRVVFFPGYIPPIFSREPYAFTIHDLNHIDRPENSSFIKRIFYRFVILNGCRRARYIFTVSEFSKKRIVEWSGVDINKVINVGNGVSEDFTPVGHTMDLPFDYFLCVSNRKAHKNEFGTIEAFKRANLTKNVKLLFTGKISPEIEQRIINLGLREQVVFTGYIKDEDLPKLYRGARALLFVSFYEGFGLPVIEAMASGVPVITSNNTSLGEVAGDAAQLVDPSNIDEIANAIVNVNSNESLRAQMKDNGLERVKKYSWDITAKRIDDVLNRVS